MGSQRREIEGIKNVFEGIMAQNYTNNKKKKLYEPEERQISRFRENRGFQTRLIPKNHIKKYHK